MVYEVMTLSNNVVHLSFSAWNNRLSTECAAIWVHFLQHVGQKCWALDQ